MKLTVYREDMLINDLRLEEDHEYIIGRKKDCDIHLENPQISRTHAVLSRKGPRWVLKKKSTYGDILINGVSQKNRILKNGDIITINPFTLNISLEQNKKNISDENEKVDDDNGPVEEELNVAKSEDSEDSEDSENTEGEKEEDNNDDNDPFSSEKSDFNNDPQQDQFNDSVDFSQQDMTVEEEKNDNNLENMNMISETGDGNEIASDDEDTKIIETFSQYKLKIFGEYAPYDEYKVIDKETFIGKDHEKCQIILEDPEISNRHAVIKRNKISLLLEDLNSTKGTILNGERINESELNNGDEFLIGDTSFTVELNSELIKAEEDRLMPVQENQVIEVVKEVEEEVDFFGGDNTASTLGSKPASKSLFSADALKDPAKRKKLIYLAIILLVLWIVLDSSDKPKKEVKKKESDKNKNLINTSKESSSKNIKTGPSIQKNPQKILTPEEREYLEAAYILAKEYYSKQMFHEAEEEVNKIFAVSPKGYKESLQLKQLIKEGYQQLTIEAQRKQKELEEKKLNDQIKKLVKRARDAVKKKNVILAESLFTQILEKDPEQPDVSLMKIEINAWKKEKERKAVAAAQKKAERRRKINELSPGKKLFLKKKWYQAIDELNKFLAISDMDEDLIKDGTKMLEEAKKNLKAEITPLLTKARSLLSGQDLKGAYENYQKILKISPYNEESMSEIENIKDTLTNRARKIYREAIIAESLSLFSTAKEKYQEVEQITPTDNSYYQKAKDKLQNYIY